MSWLLLRLRMVLINCMRNKAGFNILTSSMMATLYFIFIYGYPLVFHLLSGYPKEFNPYPTAFPYGNGMVLHFYQQQESSTTKTVHKVINKGLKAYV